MDVNFTKILYVQTEYVSLCALVILFTFQTVMCNRGCLHDFFWQGSWIVQLLCTRWQNTIEKAHSVTAGTSGVTFLIASLLKPNLLLRYRWVDDWANMWMLRKSTSTLSSPLGGIQGCIMRTRLKEPWGCKLLVFVGFVSASLGSQAHKFGGSR